MSVPRTQCVAFCEAHSGYRDKEAAHLARVKELERYMYHTTLNHAERLDPYENNWSKKMNGFAEESMEVISNRVEKLVTFALLKTENELT